MAKLEDSHHIFRHVKTTAIDGDFVDPSVFTLRVGESGLSVNWVEYFEMYSPGEAIAPLRVALEKKGRTVRPTSQFALLNVKQAKEASALYCAISIETTEDDEADPSHAEIAGYFEFNEQVAEELAKIIIGLYPAK